MLAAVDAALDKLPRVEGAARARSISRRELTRLFAEAEKVAEKAGDSFVTVERLLLAMTLRSNTPAAKALAAAGITAQILNAAIEQIRKGRTRRQRFGRGRL